MSKSSKKLLLIDGNNMCNRMFYARQDLRQNDAPTNVLYGVMRQLVYFHKQYPDHLRVIAWDKGYKRRLEESEAAVKIGLVPQGYKQARREKRDEVKYEELKEQMEDLKHGLTLTKTLQVQLDGCEADDIIHSYARRYGKHGWESVVISTDHDFYQLIDDNITVHDPTKKIIWNRERFELEFGFPPELWVDAGGIIGEVGPSKDNIFGVDGWGPKTTYKYVIEHGSAANIRKALEAKPEKDLSKREQTFLAQEDRLKLAISLKGMDMLNDIPKLAFKPDLDESALKKWLIRWGMCTMLKDVWRLM